MQVTMKIHIANQVLAFLAQITMIISNIGATPLDFSTYLMIKNKKVAVIMVLTGGLVLQARPQNVFKVCYQSLWGMKMSTTLMLTKELSK